MAILSNINDKFAVDSTGAIKFNGQVGTSGYILKSNGNTAPTWVDPDTVIGGPYLPLTGGTLTGNLAINGTNSLSVGGAGTFGGNLTINGSQTIFNPDGDSQAKIINAGTNAIALFAAAGDTLYLGGNNTTGMYLDTSANATFAGDVSLVDSKQLKLGNGADLLIFHDGANSYVKDNGTGNLLITSNGASVQINKGTTENMAEFIVDGGVKLYYDSALKFETLSDGFKNYGTFYLENKITHTGDGDTWMSFETDVISFRTGGTDRLVLNNTTATFPGNVTVNGAMTFDNVINAVRASFVSTLAGATVVSSEGSYASSGSVKLFEAKRSGGAVASDWSYDDATTDMSLGTSTAHSFSLKTGNTRALTINSSQNVGIGVNPSGNTDRLQIDNPANPTSIRIGDNTTDDCYVVFNTDGNDWSIGTDRSDSNKFKISDYSRVGTNDRLVIDTSGNVGIGTTSPTYKLHVENNNSAIVYVKSTVNNQNASIWFNSNSGGTQADRWEIGTNISAGTDLEFFDRLNSVSRMVIQNDGNVGIGTISPNEKLQVTGNIHAYAPSGIDSGLFASTAAGSTTIAIRSSGITHFNGGNVSIGNTSPQTTFHVGTTTTVTNQFTNQVNASNFFVNGNANGGASFFQCKTAAVNINMMGNNDFACNQFTFYHKPLSTSQNVVGTIATFSSSTQYNTTSDYRLKENVIPLSDSIIRLKQLKPSRFNFIEDPERTMDGFLAHEVQSIVPEAVNGEKDAVDENGNEVHQGIDQAKLVPLLVAAIQELEARVKELENK